MYACAVPDAGLSLLCTEPWKSYRSALVLEVVTKPGGGGREGGVPKARGYWAALLGLEPSSRDPRARALSAPPAGQAQTPAFLEQLQVYTTWDLRPPSTGFPPCAGCHPHPCSRWKPPQAGTPRSPWGTGDAVTSSTTSHRCGSLLAALALSVSIHGCKCQMPTVSLLSYLP